MKRLAVILLVIATLSCSTDEGIADNSSYKPNPDTGQGSDNEDDNKESDKDIQIYDFPEVIVPDNGLGYLMRSKIFSVEVSNAEQSEDVYVMADRNQYQATATTGQTKMMTTHNHTANFSFEGEITIKVKRLDGGSLEGVEVFPKAKGYNYVVKSDHVEITLSEWGYIFVEFPDLESKEPLFIFADPKETNAPNIKSPSVEVLTSDMDITTLESKITTTTKKTIYFSPGVYDFDPATLDQTYCGYKLPLLSDKDYYIAGGAVIIGSFYGDDCANSKMYGRGIITTSGKARIEDTEGIPYSLYYQAGGSGCSVEGIHFCAPAHFSILSRDNIVTRNCKMFGWWHQTDGWGGGDNAIIENCFIKADDDFIKLYYTNQQVRNIVMYKQINGAGIQFGWGAVGKATNCVVDEIYVVAEDKRTPGAINNSAIINLKDNAGSTISNNTFRNIYIEDDYQRLLGINNNGGNFNGLHLENIQVSGKNLGGTNYVTYYSGAEGKFSDFTIKNLVINGTKITSDAQWNLKQGVAAGTKITAKNLVEIKYE